MNLETYNKLKLYYREKLVKAMLQHDSIAEREWNNMLINLQKSKKRWINKVKKNI